MGLEVPLIIVPRKKAVNVVESSTTLEFNSSMSVTEINKKIEGLGRYIPYGVTVTFQFANGTYTIDDAINITGFIGGGTIHVLGNGADNTRQLAKSVVLQASGDTPSAILYARNNMVDMYIKYIRFNRYSLTQVWRHSIITLRNASCFLDVFCCSFDHSDNLYGKTVFVGGPSYCYVEESFFRYGQAAISAQHNAYIYVSNSESDASNKPAYGLDASYFGQIIDAGSVHVQGSSQDRHTGVGGQIVTG